MKTISTDNIDENEFNAETEIDDNLQIKNPILKSLESDLNPKFIQITPPRSEKELVSRYGRVQKKLLSSVTVSPSSKPHAVGYFILSPKSSPKPLKNTLSTTLMDNLIKKNYEMLNAAKNDDDEDIADNERKELDYSQSFLEANESVKISSSNVENENLGDSFESPEYEEHEQMLKLDDDCKVPKANSPSCIDEQEPVVKSSQPTTDFTINESSQISNEAVPVSVIKDDYINEIASSTSPVSNDSANGSSVDTEVSAVKSGELFWAQMGNWPYWPCMISPDPQSKTVSYKENNSSKNYIILHVKFFADNGRRNWIRADKLIPYLGKKDFQMKVDMTKGDKHKMMLKLYKKAENTPLWHEAIKEAEKIAVCPLDERQEKFQFILDETRYVSQKTRQVRRLSKSSIYDSQDSLLSTPNGNKRDRSPSYEDSLNTSTFNGNSKKRRLGIQKGVDIYNAPDFKIFSELLMDFICNNKTDEQFTERYNQLFDVKSIWKLFVDCHDGNTDLSKKKFTYKVSSTRRKSVPLFEKDEEDEAENIPPKDENRIKPKVRGIDEVVDDIFNLGIRYLTEDLTSNVFCKYCKKTGSSTEILTCSKNCGGTYHSHCVNPMTNTKKFKVKTQTADTTGDLQIETASNTDSVENVKTVVPSTSTCIECTNTVDFATCCFVCKQLVKMDVDDVPDEKVKCLSNNCGKYFHRNCLKLWPQAIWHTSSSKVNFVCPSHACHTCISENPKGKSINNNNKKLIKCIICPASYHPLSTCIPAGSQLINNSYMVCPRHEQNSKIGHTNVNWCFICAKGGELLLCCDTCPAAIHATCLKTTIPPGGYNCDDCESGRLPLYGELVWVRFGSHRWWPSLILPPVQIPLNIRKRNHFPSEFVIRFFGTNDHAWIGRRRVYLCQDDDWDIKIGGGGSAFNLGIKEAKRIMDIVNNRKSNLYKELGGMDTSASPFPYVRIRINKCVPPVKLSDLYDDEKVISCNCQKDSENPCGPNTGCLNRTLFIECDPKICPAGDKCQNQLFEKRIYPKFKIKYVKERGFGLIALESISAGTFVIEYCGEIIDTQEYHKRLQQQEVEKNDDYYFLTLEPNYFIDAGPKGNLGRFMNHSCDPNCGTQKWSVKGITRIGLFAIKDIEVNEELTFNYMFQSSGECKKICFCNTSKCSGFIGEKYSEKNNNTKKHSNASSNAFLQKIGNKRRKSTVK